MRESELGLRKTGDPKDAAYADIIADILKARGKDIPLPSTEALPDIQRFTPEARHKLEAARYRIYTLTGQSIKTLRDAGKPFWSTEHQDLPELEAMASRLSEVAINPDQLFLPGSNGKTLEEQEEMVEKFSKSLKVDGTEAIIGQMPDYVELAFLHLDATGYRLFGEGYSYNYTRTVTPTSGSAVADVGGFSARDGLDVNYWGRDGSRDGLFVAPLVVPKALALPKAA